MIGPIERPDQDPRPRHPTTLGVERLGLAAARAPVLSIAAFVIVAIAAVFGIERIEIDDSLSQLFRADTREFRQFEEVSGLFPSSEYDLLVVVEGRSLLERDSIERPVRSSPIFSPSMARAARAGSNRNVHSVAPPVRIPTRFLQQA
jgi:predicted RND superfamily exporter protein